MHGLQWDYSLMPATIRDKDYLLVLHISERKGECLFKDNNSCQNRHSMLVVMLCMQASYPVDYQSSIKSRLEPLSSFVAYIYLRVGKKIPVQTNSIGFEALH